MNRTSAYNPDALHICVSCGNYISLDIGGCPERETTVWKCTHCGEMNESVFYTRKASRSVVLGIKRSSK